MISSDADIGSGDNSTIRIVTIVTIKMTILVKMTVITQSCLI